MLQLVDAYCKRLLSYGSEVYWGGAKSYEKSSFCTGICSLEDTLNTRTLSFRSSLANTCKYLKDMSVYQ